MPTIIYFVSDADSSALVFTSSHSYKQTKNLRFHLQVIIQLL